MLTTTVIPGNFSNNDAIVAYIKYEIIGVHRQPKPIVSRVYENLYIGGAPRTSNDIMTLNNIGITAVITVQMNYERRISPVYYGARHNMILQVPDMTCPSEYQYNSAMMFIEKHMNNGGTVFVHCAHGIGRSPTIILRYLARHNNMSPSVACKFLKRRRNIIDCKCSCKKSE